MSKNVKRDHGIDHLRALGVAVGRYENRIFRQSLKWGSVR